MASELPTATILGFPVHAMSAEDSVAVAWRWLEEAGGAPRYVACANPYSIEVALADAVFARALREADLLLPDGVGMLVAGRILGRRFPERVAGMDFFTGLNARAERQAGLSCFFLGSTEETLAGIRARMARDYPHISVVGTHSPPFKAAFDAADNAAMVAAVNAAAPDILWVGMTAPKQEKWIWEHRHRLRVKLIGAVGAVFDFYAGTKVRSSPWMCRHGLEWLPRLLREPKRLWRRTVIGAPKFLARIVHQRLAGTP